MPCSSDSPLATRHLSLCLILVMFARTPATAQTLPTPDYSRRLALSSDVSSEAAGPQGLRDYVVNGKLRLALADAIRLTLLNNTDIQINRTPVDQARYAVLSAYGPFDPKLQLQSLGATRFTAPTTNQTQGTPTLSTLNQGGQASYSQTLQTGTNYNISFNTSRFTTNSAFAFINPAYNSGLALQLTQPLLRNRGFFPNRAPIVLARRNLNLSEANFAAQVNNAIQQAVIQYWNAVGARENLKVQRSSHEQAEATYKHDKRALELGALSPLEIYRSESQVAQRRVAVIQAEYFLKQAEDQFRQVIGADLDPFVRALDLDLAENPEPQGELFSIDAKTALDQALQHRPEFEAARQQLANDDTTIRLAHNGLLPDLELQGFYTANGVGGNQLAVPPIGLGGTQLASVTTPQILIPGGLGDALSQVAHFRFPTYGVTLQLNLPLRNRAARAALGTARVARRSDLYQLRKEQQTVTLEVVNAVHQLEQAKLSLEAAKIARDLGRKTLESEQRKYDVGIGQLFLVLEAQGELTQSELSVVQAEIGYQLALTAVDHATGELIERHRVEIKN